MNHETKTNIELSSISEQLTLSIIEKPKQLINWKTIAARKWINEPIHGNTLNAYKPQK